MRTDFCVTQWAAWAPGLDTQQAWRDWAISPTVPRGTQAPPLTEVPAMVRRRIEPLGRLAYHVAQACEGERRGLALVFASRHGEVARSYELLGELARGEPLSPTGFGLSVHNAVGAQYSIARNDPAPVTSVANGLFTVEAGVAEAAGLLTEHEEVLLVAYDASLPEAYRSFADEPSADWAFGWLLRRPIGATGAAEMTFRLETAAPGLWVPGLLPHGLEVLRFFLSSQASLEAADETAGWRWSRHG